MRQIRKITEDLYWIGSNDRRIARFENLYPVPYGVSYNAYLVLDEKTVLLDTVDKACSQIFFENLESALDGRSLDYVIINHMEPDHSGSLSELLFRHPDVTVVGNQKTFDFLHQFIDAPDGMKTLTVKEGDTFSSGKHVFAFAMAPMVHWPEAMVTFDTANGVLFSADAFGTFGAVDNLFADEMEFESRWLSEARRYYTNIVGKYGPQTTALLNKAASLPIQMLCPLHGPVWRENIAWYIDKYRKWGSYEPEERAVLVLYGSIYGSTQNAADIIAGRLAELGVKDLVVCDVSKVHQSWLVAEAFRCSHIVVASATYNNGLFPAMETVLSDLKAHNLQNRTIAVVENGSWAPVAGKLIREVFASMKNMTILENTVSIRSSVKETDLEALYRLSDEIAASVLA